MNIRKICSAIILCAVAITTTAQSFESLKRSKGKSALYTTVEKVLSGQMPASDAANEVSTSTQLTEPYNGKTPIYLVLEYLAHTPKDKCEEAEKLLDAFLANKKFDVNQRYSSLMPPLAYLIRENYDFLNERFSAAYISDNVLRKLIEAGASVNTYNTDGSSLMTFASSTRNKYLQDYFLKQGIDLAHRDKAGNDDAYHIISDGNVELLKRLIDEGRIEVEFKKLRNDIKDIAKHPAMYNYLAGVFAKQVNNYDEVTLFRKQFGNNKDLVQNKYEALAKKECNAAKTFNDVLNIEKRYPELTTIIGNYKRAIYDRDCNTLKQLYQESLEAAKSATLKTLNDEGFVSRFINTYKEYDPANQMPMANGMEEFFTVCNALNTNMNASYWYDYEETDLINIIFGPSHKFVFLDQKVKQRDAIFEQAKRICQTKSNWGYDSFWTKAAEELPKRYNQFLDNVDRNKDEYRRAIADYKAKEEAEAAARRAELDAKEARKRAEKEAEDLASSSRTIEEKPEKVSSSIDPETVEIPKWRVIEIKDNKTAGLGVGILREEGDYYIIYTNDNAWYTSVEHHTKIDGKYRYWSKSVGAYYDTLENAVAANYVMQKYGKVRKKGKEDSWF